MALLHGLAVWLEKLLGNGHPDTALTQHNLADFLAEEGRTQEALALSAAAVRTFESLLPEDHPKVMASRDLLRRLRGPREEA